ncbi:MAG: TrmH family RNA methyltransferase [Patescibacteria group bacterium]
MAKDLYVVCDNLRSLYNVGSIFRTSDALGVKKIYLGGITAATRGVKATSLPKGVLKVSLGAEKSVLWEQVWSSWRLVDRLKKQGFKIVALELTSNSIDVSIFKPKFPLVLIIGNEVSGVSEALLKRADAVVHIPMQGIKESLNVSVAFGIAAYQIMNK